MGSKTIVFLIIVLIAGLAWWVLKGPQGGTPSQETASVQQGESGGLGATVYEQVSQNPVTKMPDVNPFKTNTNPYSGAYKNPFGGQ